MKLGVGAVSLGGFSECLEWAKLVEGYGFDSMGYTDDAMYKPGWPFCYAAALNTSRVQLGVTVSNPILTHPSILASNTAVLDEMSNGRAYLGIARGHLEIFDMMFKIRPVKPLTMLREAIEMSKRLWSGDKTPYEGEVFYASEEACLKWSLPVRADIPVLVGAWGPKAVTMAGGLANRVLAYGVWDKGYANLLQKCIVDGAKRAGRDPAECQLELEPIFTIKESAEEAKEKAREDLAMFFPYLSPIVDHVIEPELLGRLNEAVGHGDMQKAKALISDELLDRFCLYGTPTRVIERIEEVTAATGATRVSFDMPFNPADVTEYIHLLGKKVMPHFAGK